MRYRRCHALAVLPEERPAVSLQALLSGRVGIEYEQQIRVYAAHMDKVCELDAAACMFLLSCSAEQWQSMPVEDDQRARVMELAGLGLLLLEEDSTSLASLADQRVRAGYWWSLSAIQHRHSRWRASTA